MAPRANRVLQAACLAVALLGSAAVATITTPDMALAKGGNNGKGGENSGGNGGGNGHGGGKGSHAGNNGGNGAAKSSAKATKPSRHTKTAATAPGRKVRPEVRAVIEELPAGDLPATGALSPRQKGKWNAAHANQAALDAHVRNMNFNGTIGALAQFQLAAKATAGETLTDSELAALDSFVGDADATIGDATLSDFLNADALDGDPVYSVEDGVVRCAANCDGADLDAAQAAADAETVRLRDEARQAELGSFLGASEARIVDESNKALSPADTERLLDELAATLGVERAPEVEDETGAVDEGPAADVDGDALATTGG